MNVRRPSREMPLGPGAKKDGCFHRLQDKAHLDPLNINGLLLMSAAPVISSVTQESGLETNFSAC